ncbi:MAG: hypothetical protein P8M16_09875 [Acidimicrobiales bacterium]|nr:hypothetical protein [Acidimicrobiales bacterium]
MTMTMNVGEVEQQVPAILLPGHPTLVTEVNCEDLDSGRLGAVRCTALVAGTEVPVIVHRPALDGRIRVETPANVVTGVDLSGWAAKRLMVDTGVDVSVTCTPAVRVAYAGEKFFCRATDAVGREIPLIATLLDSEGAFRLDAAPAEK